MSGPSATAKPMSAKMAVSSSITCVIGCTRPNSAGASRTGSVASPSATLRSAIAVLTLSLRPLMAGPCALRSSGVMAPSVFSSAVIEPLLPSAATRNDSSAASSLAAATAASRSFSSCAMSAIGFAAPCFRGQQTVAPGADDDGEAQQKQKHVVLPGTEDHDQVAEQAHAFDQARHILFDVAAEGGCPLRLEIDVADDEPRRDDRRHEVQQQRRQRLVNPEKIKRHRRCKNVGRQLERMDLVVERLFL